MKIDIFPHILPPKYKEALIKKIPSAAYQPWQKSHDNFPALTDLKKRFEMMDTHEDLVQVLNITLPFVETVAEPQIAIELAKIGNDELAELVDRYPDRFVAAIGNLPMNDMDAALDELERIINKLHFKGIQICTDINGKPLDAPEFMPLYEKMEKYDLPIFLHPTREAKIPDYTSEYSSKYRIHFMFGYPYDTSAAMTRLVFGQILQKYPNIKFVTHHCGAMIPYFEKRIVHSSRSSLMASYIRELNKSPIEYFKMFYADTALGGTTPGLMCGYSFFGADHILFGTDMPYFDYIAQPLVLDETIKSVEQMGMPHSDKKKIFEDNAKKILRLPN